MKNLLLWQEEFALDFRTLFRDLTITLPKVIHSIRQFFKYGTLIRQNTPSDIQAEKYTPAFPDWKIVRASIPDWKIGHTTQNSFAQKCTEPRAALL